MCGKEFAKKFMNKLGFFGCSAIAAFVIPMVVGLCVGYLYEAGVIKEEGFWVDILNILTALTLGKISFIAEVVATLYIACWAVVGRLDAVYVWAKRFLIKCFLVITMIPVFCIVIGKQIGRAHV